MKKLANIVEVEDEGMIALMGEVVTIFCVNYIYTGRLIGVNATCVLLEDPKIVYETGPFNTREWKDAQSLPNNLYVSTGAIESFGIVK